MMKTIVNQSLLQSSEHEILHQIHQASAVIYERTLTQELQAEIAHLQQDGDFIDLKLEESSKVLNLFLEENLAYYPNLRQDILQWVEIFSQETDSEKVKFLLSAVNSDMCRKFHTDVVDFRLLCTYHGIGTYYILPEDAHFKTENPPESIVQKLPIGAVVLFRGALSADKDYPALLHKSPPACKLGIKRLLLRLDTDTRHW